MNHSKKSHTSLALVVLLLATGCDTKNDGGVEETSSGGEDGTTPPPAQLRMAADVFHPSIHLFTEGHDATQVTARARKVKELVLGDPDAPTCYVGPQGTAQLAVQTEFTITEYVSAGESVERLDERLDALFDAGLAVHLLLPLHGNLGNLGNWKGVEWYSATNWSNYTAFAPMQPCAEPWSNEGQCPYDVIFEHFQRPVIEHLVETGRASKLGVIYVANEFGYNPLVIADGPADWDNASDWKRKRAEALAYTAARALGSAREAANGQVPVGLKFVDVGNSNTGWTPEPGVIGDQLAYILLTVMAPSGDVLGIDTGFDNLGFDSGTRERLSPFLSMFGGGRLDLSEFGRLCQGLPGEFVSGSRTLGSDVTGGAVAWPTARGLNVFAFTTGASDAGGGCYALTNPSDFNEVYPGAEDTAAGLWAQIQVFTGSQNPEPCAAPPDESLE